jgi:hypothetical protein
MLRFSDGDFIERDPCPQALVTDIRHPGLLQRPRARAGFPAYDGPGEVFRFNRKSNYKPKIPNLLYNFYNHISVGNIMSEEKRSPQVFVSYSRRDLAFVEQLAADLKAATRLPDV